MDILAGRYEIIKVLGGGGFAIAFLAQDNLQPSKPLCVVKQLRPNQSHPRVIEFFEKEAAILERLGKHIQIPQLLAHFTENNNLYIVQEFIEGQDLSKEITFGKKLSEGYVSKLLQDVLGVLSFVHQQGVIHRDIKPQNLMRQRPGGRIFLIDFGAVKELASLMVNNQGEIATSVVIGTTEKDLQDYRQYLGLRDDDIRAIAQRVLVLYQVEYQRQEQQTPVSQPKAPANNQIQVQQFEFEFATISSKRSGFLGMRELKWETNYTKKRAEFFKENLGNGVNLDMVAIPGGTFLMGSPDNEQGHLSRESPQHRVTIQPFFMGKFAVTQAQYQAITENNPAYFKGANQPVENVSWDDAVEFCKKISRKTGRNYRLPSEAEWEYACRAATTTPFYFGETITTDLANYCGTTTPYGSAPKGVYRKETTEVGKFPPNAFGLYDMHGNVWEWCQDDWNDNYNGAPDDGSAWFIGNDNKKKLLRGGSWSYNPAYCRSAYRFYNTLEFRNSFIGFRLVCSA